MYQWHDDMHLKVLHAVVTSNGIYQFVTLIDFPRKRVLCRCPKQFTIIAYSRSIFLSRVWVFFIQFVPFNGCFCFKMNYSLHFCKIAAPCESAWASNWATIDGAIQSPAILPAGWGCIVTRNGSIAAIIGRNAGWVPWPIRIFWERGKLYGSNGYGHG